MGILDNVERGLERAVGGAFARTFRSKLQPVEIAAALRRELDTHAAIVDREHTLAPNSFRVHVSTSDHERLTGLGDTLLHELVAAVNKHAGRQGYRLAGPAEVLLVADHTLGEGMLSIDSETLASTVVWVPALDIAGERHILTGHSTVIGRGSQADIAVDDTGVSRRHLEILWEDDTVTARDLGSTNGSTLDGAPLTRAVLRPDSVITIGNTRITYRLVPRQVRQEHTEPAPPPEPWEKGGTGRAEPWDQADPPEPWEQVEHPQEGGQADRPEPWERIDPPEPWEDDEGESDDPVALEPWETAGRSDADEPGPGSPEPWEHDDPPAPPEPWERR